MIESEDGGWQTARVRTESSWHFVGEASSLGPRVRFSDDHYHLLVKRVTVSVADEDAPAGRL